VSVEISLDAKGIEEFQAAMKKLDSAIQRQVHRRLHGLVADIKASAQQRVPVRTGYLRSTIYAKVKEWIAEVGAEASYALYVELGTRYMRARPYLYPAIQEYLPQLEAIILEAIETAKREAKP